MSLHPLAGKPAPRSILVDVPRLVSAYYVERPDPAVAGERVAFGTSGHRGSAFERSFNEAHIHATTQAICDYRSEQQVAGPLYLGKDTHALSEPAFLSALEVLAANGVETRIDQDLGFTPTPVISHAILNGGPADGIVVTPSHNPPSDGGFKYNPAHGGPAGSEVTGWIERRANALLADANREVRRLPARRALAAATTKRHDFISAYVADLGNVVDLPAIAGAGVRIGADPMGGAGLRYWERIAERYRLRLEVVNDVYDPTFAFMSVDKDGKIRMDCSSPYAMASLVALRHRFDIAWGNDTDFDRHGIVTPSAGLMNPNHYLAVAIEYLLAHRPAWGRGCKIGKTLVSSSMIDRVVRSLGRELLEVPVGFKWFVDGLRSGSLCFGGEESAGASFLRTDGRVWTTDKDGFILALLSAEICATTDKDPGEHYRALTERHGTPEYQRLDAPANAAQKRLLGALSPQQVRAETLAGEPIVAKLTAAPGNGAGIGGLKVVTENGWFAARPSGTEDVYKIYCESFLGLEHLARIQSEAQAIVSAVFAAAG